MYYGSPYLEELLRILTGYLNLKKLLKGNAVPESAKDGAIVLNGNTITISESVINVYLNSPVNEAVSKAAIEIEKDENITGIEFLKGDQLEQIEVVSREQLSCLHSVDASLDLEPKKSDQKKKNAALVVRKAVLFDSKDKWSFLCRDRPISVDVLDTDWLKKVTASIERFGAGDRLIVDLIIHKEWNPALQAFEEKRFSVDKVHSHIPRNPDRQRRLFEEPQNVKKQKGKKKPAPRKAAKKVVRNKKPKKGKRKN